MSRYIWQTPRVRGPCGSEEPRRTEYKHLFWAFSESLTVLSDGRQDAERCGSDFTDDSRESGCPPVKRPLHFFVHFVYLNELPSGKHAVLTPAARSKPSVSF